MASVAAGVVGYFALREAGAMAFVFALLCVSLIYRGLTAKNLSEAVGGTVAVTVAATSPFAWIFTFEQKPQKIAEWLAALTGNKIYFLLFINLLLTFVGLFVEMIAAMAILVPILVPAAVAAGVDTLQFGIIMVMNLVIGALTPRSAFSCSPRYVSAAYPRPRYSARFCPSLPRDSSCCFW